MKIILDRSDLLTLYLDKEASSDFKKQYMIKVNHGKDTMKLGCLSVSLKAEDFLAYAFNIGKYIGNSVCEYIEKLFPDQDIERQGINMTVKYKDDEVILRFAENFELSVKEIVEEIHKSNLF